MTLTEFLESVSTTEVLKDCGIGVLILATLLQIAPIKINPWGWLAKKIGHAINGELFHRIDGLEKELATLRTDTTEQSIINCRVRILQFGDELLRGTRHSKDRFDQTLQDIDIYENYCRTHEDFKNNITAMTVQRIKTVYEQLLASGDFL